MKKKYKILTVISAVLIALSVPVIVFFARAPVLIIADQMFSGLYGQKRITLETFRSSLALFRQVKTVEAAYDAGDDIIRFAVQEAGKNPYFVIFPLRFARSAVYYHEHNPQVRIIILEGRYLQDSNSTVSSQLAAVFSGQDDNFFVFRTDIDNEFYKAGQAAAALAGNNAGKIVVFIEPGQNLLFGKPANDAFSRGVNEYFSNLMDLPYITPEILFFTAFSDCPEDIVFSCIVMAGAGSEYFENGSGIPVILFSWLDPFYAPPDTALIIDDSIWAQAVRAVKTAETGVKDGLIKSIFHFSGSGKFDKELVRQIKKSQQD